MYKIQKTSAMLTAKVVYRGYKRYRYDIVDTTNIDPTLCLEHNLKKNNFKILKQDFGKLLIV